MAVSIETLADEIYKMVVELQGKKNVRAMSLTKAMIDKYGAAECSKEDCKQAIRQLIDSGRCVYGYYGGESFITIPRKEETAAE
jgi:hypothetical protein